MEERDIKDFRDTNIEAMNRIVADALRPAFDTFFDWAMSLTELNNLLTQADAARYKNCSRQTIQRAIRKGQLPTYTRYSMVLLDDVLKLQIKGKE